MEHIYIGPVPCEEACAQVGDPNYYEKAKPECKAFIRQLWRTIEKEKGLTSDSAPDSFCLTIKSEQHDFGLYHEVVAKFDENDETAMELAYWVESNTPMNWDAQAKRELGLTTVQVACDICTLGVMDGDNPHFHGKCNCECHHND